MSTRSQKRAPSIWMANAKRIWASNMQLGTQKLESRWIVILISFPNLRVYEEYRLVQNNSQVITQIFHADDSVLFVAKYTIPSSLRFVLVKSALRKEAPRRSTPRMIASRRSASSRLHPFNEHTLQLLQSYKRQGNIDSATEFRIVTRFNTVTVRYFIISIVVICHK